MYLEVWVKLCLLYTWHLENRTPDFSSKSSRSHTHTIFSASQNAFFTWKSPQKPSFIWIPEGQI